VAALASAFVVGGALGAYWQDLEGDNELLTLKNESLNAQIAAADAARKDERNARAAAADVLDQPTTVRVLCRTEPIAGGVPGAGGTDTAGQVLPSGPERDIAARLQRVLAVDSYNRELINGAAKRHTQQ
jgi:hypothetical protein